MVNSVEGIRSAKVMVTLESGTEFIYEKEENLSYDRNEDHGESGENSVQQSEERKESYIIVEDANGKKTALLKKRLEPQIRGVIVVCKGDGNAAVEKSVYDLVTTSLGIGYDKVCVIKSK